MGSAQRVPTYTINDATKGINPRRIKSLVAERKIQSYSTLVVLCVCVCMGFCFDGMELHCVLCLTSSVEIQF